MSNELINFEYKGVPDPDFSLRYILFLNTKGIGKATLTPISFLNFSMLSVEKVYFTLKMIRFLYVQTI